MTLAPRWRKLMQDFRAIRGRIAMMVAAIAVGVFSVATIASAYVILTREISRNYVDTNPASALIDLGHVDPAMVDAVRRRPDIAAAEATSIVTARVRQGDGEWAPMLLFVIPDFNDLNVNEVFAEAGAFPPEAGAILLEREALRFLGSSIGDSIEIETPTGPRTTVRVSGTVHDPSLAPAWQEQTAYGYLTPAALAQLGGDPNLDILKVVVRDALHDQARVDAVTSELALSLQAQGLEVHGMQVPPTGRHPHQSQMTAVLAMFVVFAFLAFVLSAILTASMVGGLLAQQVRQIAVMKAIGARTTQISQLYLTGVLAVAAASVAIGVPLGLYGGRGFAGIVAQLLNFTIVDDSVQAWMVALFVLVGVLIPLAFALVPISRATSMTIRDAIADYGVSQRQFGASRLDGLLGGIRGIDRTLILAIRNAFRRRSRLVLTMALLGAAGAMFLASLNVEMAWKRYIDAAAQDRNYDMEVRLGEPAPADAVLELLSDVPGVDRAEPWRVIAVAADRADGLTIVRTYPDGGHGNLDLRSLPSAESLAHLQFLEGRAIQPGEASAIVLNQGARGLLSRPHAGDTIGLIIGGRRVRFTIVGIARQILTPAAAYVSSGTYDTVVGDPDEVNAIRVSTSRHDRGSMAAVAAAIQSRFDVSGIRVQQILTETQFANAVSGHVRILIVSLVVMSILMAIVGALGLASAQGANVAERTREIGIMRTIGGAGSVVIRNVIAEGVFVGLLSCVLAIALSLPLAYGIGNLVGMLSFGLPLPLSVSAPALLIWLAIIVVGSVVASIAPAVNAARLTVRQTLAHI